MRSHFRDCFVRCSDPPFQEFRSYLADFPRIREADAVGCEGLVTKYKFRDALKHFNLNKSPKRRFTLRSVLEAVPHCCAYSDEYVQPLVRQRPIPGSATKGVIILLKKGGRHVWKTLDDNRPITLLNTELKILARVLANRLQLFISG